MLSEKRVDCLLAAMSGKRILVCGDVILDRYVFGKMERISPEAPVPIIKVEREEFRLGGAGNVAANIDRLEASSLLLGLLGDDAAAAEIFRLKAEGNACYRDPNCSTVIKTRFISQRQQVLRVDREVPLAPGESALAHLRSVLQRERFDGIIVSDYAKGTVGPEVMKELLESGLPVLVDPKPAQASLYRGVAGLTPNLREAREMTGIGLNDENDILRALRRLRRRFALSFAVITRGEDGISALDGKGKLYHLPAFSHEVFDVSGAGDTVTAVLMLALAAGASLGEAVALANGAASLVVERVGACQVSPLELKNRMRQLSLS